MQALCRNIDLTPTFHACIRAPRRARTNLIGDSTARLRYPAASRDCFKTATPPPGKVAAGANVARFDSLDHVRFTYRKDGYGAFNKARGRGASVHTEQQAYPGRSQPGRHFHSRPGGVRQLVNCVTCTGLMSLCRLQDDID